jgi:hypothetical protein
VGAESTLARIVHKIMRWLGRSLLEPVSELGLWARKNRTAIQDARRRFWPNADDRPHSSLKPYASELPVEP